MSGKQYPCTTYRIIQCEIQLLDLSRGDSWKAIWVSGYKMPLLARGLCIEGCYNKHSNIITSIVLQESSKSRASSALYLCRVADWKLSESRGYDDDMNHGLRSSPQIPKWDHEISCKGLIFTSNFGIQEWCWTRKGKIMCKISQNYLVPSFIDSEITSRGWFDFKTLSQSMDIINESPLDIFLRTGPMTPPASVILVCMWYWEMNKYLGGFALSSWHMLQSVQKWFHHLHQSLLVATRHVDHGQYRCKANQTTHLITWVQRQITIVVDSILTKASFASCISPFLGFLA